MGFLSNLGESLRAHIDERVRSPFAGSFIIAWLAINWKGILILCFSVSAIELRIAEVSKNHFTENDTIWYPLGLAALITIAFYIASAIFTVLAELYASVQSLIEKWFDHIKWISPKAYISYKKNQQEKISELQELATDNLRLVEQEKTKAQDLSDNLITTQNNLNEMISEVASKNTIISGLNKDIEASRLRQNNLQTSIEFKNENLKQAAGLVNNISRTVASVLLNSKKDNGDFIYTDKENLIVIGNSLKIIRSQIEASIGDKEED